MRLVREEVIKRGTGVQFSIGGEGSGRVIVHDGNGGFVEFHAIIN